MDVIVTNTADKHTVAENLPRATGILQQVRNDRYKGNVDKSTRCKRQDPCSPITCMTMSLVIYTPYNIVHLNQPVFCGLSKAYRSATLRSISACWSSI